MKFVLVKWGLKFVFFFECSCVYESEVVLELVWVLKVCLNLY